jgi:DNA-binding transcriptional ArsR family regulator
MSPHRARKAPLAIADAAPVFAALGDATRLAVVARLGSGGPLSIAQLTEGSDVTRQAITKHLNVLAGAGLVRDSWRGRERIWEFDVQRFDDARRCIDEISEQWNRALLRLKSFVEDDKH